MKKIKIVLDTNVLVSAVGWKGKAGKILESCVAGRTILILSPAILDEFKKVIFLPKFNFIPDNKKDEFVALLTELAEICLTENKLNIITEDTSDNRILECGLAGGADYIVSGDIHLLKVKSVGNVEIINPAAFCKLFFD